MSIPVEIRWLEPLYAPLPLPVEVAARVQKALGRADGPLLLMGDMPWLLDLIVDGLQLPIRHLDKRSKDVVSVVAAQENACRYCYGINRAVLRIQGWDEARIRQIEQAVDLADDPQLAAVIAFARALSRSNPRPAGPERARLLGVGFTPVQVAELAFVASVNAIHNRVMTFLAAKPEEAIEAAATSRWGVFARPLLRMMMTPRPGRDYSQEERWTGPYAPLIGLLDGTPGAHVVSHTLRAAFEQGVLSRQTKLLTFAVVARSLGCEACTDEASVALVNEGMSKAEVDRAIATLECSQLPQNEQGVLRWVRGTVRYVPDEIQASTRRLDADLGRAGTLDAIGTAALANGMVRLAMLGV